jgi:subtilisin-like proprotein convertase family protein
MCARRALFPVLLSIVCLASALPVSADVEVRFFAEGELILGAHVSVLVEAPVFLAEKHPPSTDGVYRIGVDRGTKVTFNVRTATTEYAPLTVAIPESVAETIDVVMVAVPANDACTDAIGLGLPSVTAGSTIGATPDICVHDCGTSISAPGVWYEVTGTGNTMTASTCNDGNPATGSADYDSKINVYCRLCDILTCVAGNDDGPGCAGFSSQVSWCSEALWPYHIFVQGFFGEVGNFELAVFDDGIPCDFAVPCYPGPPPLGACCSCLPAPFNCTEETSSYQCEILLEGEWHPETRCHEIHMPPEGPCGPMALEIPDGSGEFVCDTIDVEDSLIINDLNVSMRIFHTWIGDLEITLEHDGTLLRLWDHQCASTDNINSTADDEYNTIACAEIAAGPLFDIRWPPAIAGLGPLSIFDGMDAAGAWDLCAADTFPLDSGGLSGWDLQFNDQLPPSICDDPSEVVGLCHCPPGHNVHDETGACVENDHCRTIDIADTAIPSHLANHACDYLGPCVDD